MNLSRAIFFLVIVCLSAFPLFGQGERKNIEIAAPKNYQASRLTSSPELDAVLRAAVNTVLDPDEW